MLRFFCASMGSDGAAGRKEKENENRIGQLSTILQNNTPSNNEYVYRNYIIIKLRSKKKSFHSRIGDRRTIGRTVVRIVFHSAFLRHKVHLISAACVSMIRWTYLFQDMPPTAHGAMTTFNMYIKSD